MNKSKILIILTASFFIFQSTYTTLAVETNENKKNSDNNILIKSADKIAIISKKEAIKIGINALKVCFNIEVDNKNKIKTEQSFTQDNDINKNQNKSNACRYGRFEFPRIENGIIVQENGLNISIDLKTGNISTIQLNWDHDLVFQSTKKILNEQNAKSKFLQNYNSQLYYSLINDEPNFKTDFNYKLDYDSAKIDATSGKVIYIRER